MPPVVPFSRLQAFTVTAPKSTAIASPKEIATKFNPGVVVGIDVEIPNGHFGLTGIAIAVGHTPVLPEATGTYVIGNDDLLAWTVLDQPNSGAWSAFVYNTDPKYDHNFYLRFYVVELQEAALAAPPPPTPLHI